jgi:hypothetical protein
LKITFKTKEIKTEREQNPPQGATIQYIGKWGKDYLKQKSSGIKCNASRK